MEVTKLQPILKKESTLKTANAPELRHAPQDVLKRYQTYALTHVPLGDTSKQLANLQRVIIKNKTCAIGTIVGPYGYGKTSTAVHLWNELRQRQILAIPPFLWINLQQLLDAVYYWSRFEFEQGPATYVKPLEELYMRYAGTGLDRLGDELDRETARDLFDRGLLNLELRPQDVVTFFSDVTNLAQLAGYDGLAVFTDELQATVAEYKPTRDQFFNDLFQLVKDTLGRSGNWTLINSMDDNTEGIIARLRADLLQRMQHSALYFRVEEVYKRRQYPAELWHAFETRFGFDGSDVILPETLESIGQIASRSDLGAGPRMVTNALSLAVAYYEQNCTPYTPQRFVNDFLDGLIHFDQRGKFPAAVKKSLENVDVAASDEFQDVIKLLAAYPSGCSEDMLSRFNLLDSFQAFPPLARKELVVRRAEGHTLRYLLEEERPPEQVEQRLTQEFVARYAPIHKYAAMAAVGFLNRVLLDEIFNRDWKSCGQFTRQRAGTKYQIQQLVGTFDDRYPQRKVTLAIAAMSQSAAPSWDKFDTEADIELRFEFNYGISPTEPSQLLVAPKRPDVAVFQFNLNAVNKDSAQKVLPDILFDYYNAEQLTPQLTLALVHYMFAHSGDLPDDIHRVRAVAAPLRQFALTLLLGENLMVNREDFSSGMVGYERIKELFRLQCQMLYPHYHTLIKGRRWQQDLQQYSYALDRVSKDDGVAVARGRRPWETTKREAADAFTIPNRSLTRLETLLNGLGELIEKEEYSGRQASSPIRLRFHLHPLETQWLEELEGSEETAYYNGMQASAMNAIELIHHAQAQGYLLEEIQKVIALMVSRQFVTYDQGENLLIRRIDNIVEIKERVRDELQRLTDAVDCLETAVPEFERKRFPLSELRERLEEVAIREEAEILKGEIRRYFSTVNSFAGSRSGDRREKYSRQVGKLNNLIQAGVPQWLSQPFAPGPLHDLLEQQRCNYVEAFEKTLRDMRELARKNVILLQDLPESPLDSLVFLQKALPEFCRASERLQTRLKSYTDIREDIMTWRSLLDKMNIFTEQSTALTEKYGTDRWEKAAAALWKEAQDEVSRNLLNFPTLHRDIDRQLEEKQRELDAWLRNQFVDYEEKRQRYEKVLNSARLEVRLRIPFNAHHPAESYDALIETVQQYVFTYLNGVQHRLNVILQKLRYAMLVQQVDLKSVEAQAKATMGKVNALRDHLSPELLRDMERAEIELLQPLQNVFEEEQKVAAEMQQALQKRKLTELETELLEALRTITESSETDFYSLIMYQLDHGDGQMDLDHLMSLLQGLLQKNQIGIRIRVL